MQTSLNRRQAVTALLAGLGATAVGCDPDPVPDDSPDGDAPTIDQSRFAAALSAVFTGTPFEDDASALPGQIQADIDRLTEQGMTSTAKLLERSASILMVPAFEVQATLLSTPDLNTDPQPLALAYAEGLAGFLENRDDMVALLQNALTEVTADLGGDAVSPDQMADAAATVLDHEQRNRKWMYENGQSGEAWANHILRGGQSLRADAAVDQSLSSVVENTIAATLEVGEFDDTMSVVTATARVAPATPARCSRRACSCGCAARTRSAACTRRAARTGASLAPTRGSSRRGKALTRMSATPGKNAPIATEDAPEMDRAVFAAATGLFSPVGTSPRVRP